MQKLWFAGMFLRNIFYALLLSSSGVLALHPAERVSDETSVFFEGAPLAEGLTAMRGLVAHVAGEGMWSMMAANFEQEIGFNPLNPQELETNGIDPNKAWGIAVNIAVETIPSTKKPDFTFIIPTTGSTKFFDLLKAKIKEKSTTEVKESDSGRALSWGSEADPGYLLRTDDALLLSNSEKMARSMRSRSSNPMARANFYTSMRKHILEKNENKAPLVAYYINPKMILASVESQIQLIRALQKELNEGREAVEPLSEDSPYIKEIKENLESAGGAFTLDAKKVTLSFAYKYKTGYFANSNNVYPKILVVKTDALASDALKKTPVSYALGKINVMPLLDFFKAASPVFQEKFDGEMKKIKEKIGIDFEKSILQSFRGNFNFNVVSIPVEKKMRDPQSWGMFGALGIKEGTENGWISLFRGAERYAKKKGRKTTFKFEKLSQGQLVTITEKKSFSEDKAPKTETFVVLITDSEVVMSNSKANALKALQGKGTALTERILKEPYEAVQGMFFIDFEQVLKAILKTQQGSTLQPYANFLEKLKDFSIVSSIKNDIATAETTLRLRNK